MTAESLIEIDGAQGEGGGQIIRTSLALSAITGKPFRVINIRAGRRKPGLKNQHLMAVEAARRVCNATLTGDQLASSSLTFEPNAIVSGNYAFEMQTAGSTTLVAQTVLPALILGDTKSTITVVGGTHNPLAPTFDFFRRSYLPQLAKSGPQVEASIERHGLFPRGGGKIELQIQPCETLRGFELLERGALKSKSITALVAALPADIGQREISTFCCKSGWSKNCGRVLELEGNHAPGNVLMADIEYENVTASFTAYGERGKTAERVAGGLYREVKAYLDNEAPVEEYLADQLMLPMGVAASRGQTSCFRTGTFSGHSETHLDLLKRFLDIETSVEKIDDSYQIQIRPRL